MKVVAIFSGGMDSTAMLYSLVAAGHEVKCIGFDYGQRHRVERDHAERAAVALYGYRYYASRRQLLLRGSIAYLAPRGNRKALTIYLALGAIAALACQYLCGSVGMMFRADMSFGQALAVNVPFLIPDLIKAACVVAIASGVHLSLPDIRRKAFLK